MDTTKLQTYITNPSSITSTDLTEIEQSLIKYPYCSTLHILYLKGLSNTNSIHFDEALRKSSIHVNDRAQLFNIINEEILTDKTEEENLLLSEKQVEAVQVQSIADADQTEPVVEKETSINQDEAILDKSNASDNSLLENLPSIEESEEVLEKEIIASVVDSSLIFDVDNIDRIEAENAEPQTEILEPIELEFVGASLVDNSVVSQQQEPEEKSIEVDIENLSFSEWLKFKKSGINLGSSEKAPSAKTESGKNEIEFEQSDLQTPDPKLTKKEINYLLDKFIEEEPRFSKPKKEFYNPLSNAKKSLDDQDILVSETLAKIYHLQKNYSKAIKAYEQLSLLNPKKKSFFANQIKKIQKEELK